MDDAIKGPAMNDIHSGKKIPTKIHAQASLKKVLPRKRTKIPPKK